MNYLKIIPLCLLFLQSTFADLPKKDSLNLSLGVGVVASENIRRDNTYDKADKATLILPIPMVNFNWGRFSIGGQGAQFSLYKHPLFSPYLLISRGGDKYYGEGLDKRKASWFTGLGLRVWRLNFTIKKDINNNSDSTIGDIAFNYGHKLFESGLFLRASINLEILSSKYTQYYYGVSEKEANSKFSQYTAKTAFNKSLNLQFLGNINKKTKYMFGPGFKVLDSQISNSPTVRKSKAFFLIMGIMYEI